MRYIALIFAFVIFGQSLSVCAPSIYHLSKKTESPVCKVEYADGKELPKCCKKSLKSQDERHDSEDEDSHGCCGDNCKCLCCVKVFIKQLPQDRMIHFSVKALVLKNIYPVYFHSFDYHSDTFHPPQSV